MRRVPFDLLVLVLAYLVLALAYGVATPILEVSDESTHVATTWGIAAGHGLPIMDPSDRRRVLVPAQEAGQPPLSHLLDAAITFWIHSPNPARSLLVNPQANVGSPSRDPWNKNMFVHSPGEGFPWHGLALSVHLQRFLSILWGAIAVVGTYVLARLAFPSRAVLPFLASALIAFNPMFLLLAGSADNDALTTALCTLALLILSHTLRRGYSWRAMLLVGMIVGLATLTKLNAAALALPAVLVGAWLAWRQRSFRLAWQYPLLTVLPAGLLSGWWFLRNWQLYHDPLALNVFLQIVGRRALPLSPFELFAEFPGLWLSFWGVLGNFNILLPAAWYDMIDVVAALAGVGLLLALWRHRHQDWSIRSINGVVLLLGGWAMLQFFLLVRYTELVTASTGRLLLGAAPSIAILLALGLLELAGRVRWCVAGAVTALFGLGATLALPLAVIPAYLPPVFAQPQTLHPAHALAYRYGQLQLIGATTPRVPTAPGSDVHVTLYWRALAPLSQEDVISLQLLGPDGKLVSQADSLPDGGKVLAAAWPPGTAISDTIPLHIPLTGPSPAVTHLAVFVYPLGEPNHRLAATDAAGKVTTTPVVGTLAVVGVNPYTLLAAHRPDVLRFYAANGWNSQTQGRQIFDNWLAHGPDGGKPTTAAAYVKAKGWEAAAAP